LNSRKYCALPAEFTVTFPERRRVGVFTPPAWVGVPRAGCQFNELRLSATYTTQTLPPPSRCPLAFSSFNDRRHFVSLRPRPGEVENLDREFATADGRPMAIELASDVEAFLQKQLRAGVGTDLGELVNDVLRSVGEQQRKKI